MQLILVLGSWTFKWLCVTTKKEIVVFPFGVSSSPLPLPTTLAPQEIKVLGYAGVSHLLLNIFNKVDQRE